ncbi:hypothetical protein [Paracoccus sediminicola]|uniref:hypothetical protein n=1 Tax=Paracoccus sediminicola TaxID=3017783 RepID=UPI0022F0F6F2|nr:hypothetical protein [Paracoccus sediminicola]WBU57190.1 hypothetical protein PAF18_01715 [Paracoccus sediminicola]
MTSISNTYNYFTPQCSGTTGCQSQRGFGGLFGGAGSNSGLQGFDMLMAFAGLASLARMLGGNESGSEGSGSASGAGEFSFLDDALWNGSKGFDGESLWNASEQTEQPAISGSARIWGDPHFIGADGGKYDVQGEAGKTYNLLSDRGFQMNGTFEKWGNGGATVVGKAGITAGSNYVEVDKSGAVIVNGQALKDGDRVGLSGGGYVEKNGDDITVKKGEWEVEFQTKGNMINMDIDTANAVSDGVRPHGLIGQTFDGDGKARNGDKGKGAQGGGAIERADGSMSRRGDKDTVESYEVGALFDTSFGSHNADDAQNSRYVDMAQETMQFAMMLGYATLTNSLLSSASNSGYNSWNSYS